MTKSTTTDSRSTLTAELEAIRSARENEEKSFKAALEKLYADHRKAMAELKTRRENAWKTYGEDRQKPAEKSPAKKAAAKKSAKKSAKKPAAKKVPAKVAAVLPDEFANG